MKPIKRDPIRFDVFNALAQFSREQRLSVTDPKTTDHFLQQIRSSVHATVSNESFLYGQRTQAMFEALVLSLGKVQFLKQEDSGALYSTQEELEVPDYLLVFQDGTKLLIEVKNFYQKNDFLESFEVTESYLNGLNNYSRLVGCELMVATYWVKWNRWTLVRLGRFELGSGIARLSFLNAVMFDELSLVGDRMIGCRFPLAIHMETRKDQPRAVQANGEVSFHIADMKIFCADQEVTSTLERNIAWYLINHGNWVEEPTQVIINDGQLDGLKFEWFPQNYREDRVKYDAQGFAMIGTLSEMFSHFFRAVTQSDGRIGQIQVDVTPGHLGQMIPDDYEGERLPLWRFELHPKDEKA